MCQEIVEHVGKNLLLAREIVVLLRSSYEIRVTVPPGRELASPSALSLSLSLLASAARSARVHSWAADGGSLPSPTGRSVCSESPLRRGGARPV
jgi:hypothetical protein